MTADPPHDPSGAGSSRGATSETGRSALARIDDALVPRLQRVVRPVARLLGLPARGLRALDQRLAGGSPARAVRAHRGLAAFVTVALAFGAVAVHAQRYPQLQEQARQDALGSTGSSTGSGSSSGDDLVTGEDRTVTRAVGPVVDARVEPYLADRRGELADSEDGQERTAVVSFTTFLEPGEVGTILGDVQVHRIQYRLPERTPRPTEMEVVDDDVVATVNDAIDELVAELRVEEAEVASTLESGVEDEAFRADYEARLDELKGLRNTLTANPAIVFAAVVTAPVGDLKAIARDDEVRLVDLAPEGTEPATTAFFGVLPTDHERFGFGRSS